MDTIVVGSKRKLHKVAKVRDPRQRAAVMAIVESREFDFARGNPFIAAIGRYTGPFQFEYFTKDGVHHSVRIAKDGTIIRRTSDMAVSA